MAASQSLLLPLLALFTLVSATLSRQPSIIRIPSDRDATTRDDDLYCSSWRLSVETNNAGYWVNVPPRCKSYVEDYMNGDQFRSDSKIIACKSLEFAKTVVLAGDGKDAWVFDIGDTLLSNQHSQESFGFGSEHAEEFKPALPASLHFYNEVKQLGFTIFLISYRNESRRGATVRNLLREGYSGWERLFLRGDSDQDKPAIVYKSQKRSDLVYEGYRIHGSSGDQWSDLLGDAVAERSFKLPNPTYFIP